MKGARPAIIAASLVIALSGATALDHAPTPLDAATRARLKLPDFYQKHINIGGLPIVGSARVSDAAMGECAWICQQMLRQRPDILRTLGEAGVRFAVMAHTEYTTDVPEHAGLTPRVYWDRRARGLGATPDALAVSAGEENLLAFPGDPYPREIIAIHEFAHAIHEMALNRLDPTFDARLQAAHARAREHGLWKGTYAATNRQEYWAEAVQAWFDNNASNDALHNDVNTRTKLQAYDPEVAALCAEVFGEVPWRYVRPAERPAAERGHLAGLPKQLPRFQWREEPVPERPRVIFQCAAGEAEWEFDATVDRARVTKLLAEVHRGYFSSGRAVFQANEVLLRPAERTPGGAAVPPEAKPWRITFSAAKDPEALQARVRKGEALLPQLLERSTKENGVPVQRIVRLN